jgi:zinc/manganese transport system substrate-binding protein
MIRTCLIALVLTLSLGARAHAAPLTVVTTVPDLAALTAEVGGAHVRVSALVLPTQDPHFVDAKPSMALALSRADLLIAVGLDLETGWLPTLQLGARNPRIQAGAPGYLECAAFAELLEVPTARLDRAHGDVHPGGNPHFLYDPRNAARVAAGIAERLAKLDPANAAAYAANLRDFRARLAAAQARWERQLAPLRGQTVVTYHKSMVYLAAWLGLVIVAELEPKPGIPPTAGHVAHVLSAARKRGVRLVLQEAYYPRKTSELVANKVPARLVVLAGGANVGLREGYVARMQRVVDQLVAGAR